MFLRNGYYGTFFDRVVTSFQQRQSAGTGQVKEKKDINFNLLLRIPYVGTLSHEFKSKITNLFHKELNIEIFPIFKTTKLSEFFSLKSQTPKALTSNVVYKFTCLCDTSLTYVGKTKRHLVVRAEEHVGYEKEKPEGEIKTHLKTCDLCKQSNLDNFQIVKKMSV